MPELQDIRANILINSHVMLRKMGAIFICGFLFHRIGHILSQEPLWRASPLKVYGATFAR